MSAINRFWSGVDVLCNAPCWIWYKSKTDQGYGHFKINNKTIYCHRFSYEYFIGNINKKLYVLHKCDNPSCVNPRHLFCGTQKENVLDMWNKKRGFNRKGEQHPCHKLKKTEILEIRKIYKFGDKYFGQHGLSKKYKVAQSTINYIVNNKIWKNV